MDSKEGIEKAEPVDAQVGALLDPSHLQSGPDATRASILDMGVLKDSKELLEQDRLIPDYSWNAVIC